MKVLVQVVTVLLHIAYVCLGEIAAIVSKPDVKDPIVVYRTISEEITLSFVWHD